MDAKSAAPGGMAGRGAVLVVGGGVSGLTAALEAAEAGADVWLLEREPSLGGRVANMSLYFPKLCPPFCGLELNQQRLRRNPAVRVLTQTEVASVSGEPGAFRVDVLVKPRFVNERCTACGDCVAACPVERPNPRNQGRDRTKAIFLPHGMAWPRRYVIDPAVCPGASCGKCLPACKAGAIDLGMKEERRTLDIGAVVLATGWKPYPVERLEMLGAGKISNVVTNAAFERLAASDGPTGGKILRPSDGRAPKSVAFIQCAGSRDENHLPYCSAVCCLASLKQAEYVRRQCPEAEVSIFYIDLRAPGRLELFLEARRKDPKLKLVKGKAGKLAGEAGTGNVIVEVEDALARVKSHGTFEMAVLATGIVPEEPGAALSALASRDAHGFFSSAGKGVVPAGCAKRPAEVSACTREATGAAGKALQSARGR